MQQRQSHKQPCQGMPYPHCLPFHRALQTTFREHRQQHRIRLHCCPVPHGDYIRTTAPVFQPCHYGTVPFNDLGDNPVNILSVICRGFCASRQCLCLQHAPIRPQYHQLIQQGFPFLHRCPICIARDCTVRVLSCLHLAKQVPCLYADFQHLLLCQPF